MEGDAMGTTAAAINTKNLSFNSSLEDNHELSAMLPRCWPSFYRRAYQYLGNSADAEDAVQSALLSAYKHIGQFRGQAQLSTWMSAIVVNSARMQLRKRPRQIHVPLDHNEDNGDQPGYSVSERLACTGASPEEECRGTELRERVMRLTVKLSPPLRKAFELRVLDGLSVRETARILQTPEGTVKAQVARARAKLKRLLHKPTPRQRRPTQPSRALNAAQAKKAA
jgi:RNA polymerase sigma-70 factor (ECF subfamily)